MGTPQEDNGKKTNPADGVQTTLRGLIFTVRIQPRASKNEIVGRYGDAFKLRLTAPPVDNAANQLCIRFLAKAFQLPKKSLQIISGQRSRTKTILCRWPFKPFPQKEQAALKQTLINGLTAAR